MFGKDPRFLGVPFRRSRRRPETLERRQPNAVDPGRPEFVDLLDLPSRGCCLVAIQHGTDLPLLEASGESAVGLQGAGFFIDPVLQVLFGV